MNVHSKEIAMQYDTILFIMLRKFELTMMPVSNPK